MTSDAKIGLLLGLFFIFIIAFLINGLPKLGRESDNSELTNMMTGSDDSTLGIGAERLRIIGQGGEYEGQSSDYGEYPAHRPDPGIRSEFPLSPIHQAVEELEEQPPAVPGAAEAVQQQGQDAEPQPAKVSGPRFYVVQAGDSLAAIAKKLYGADQGNVLANINRIFQANRNVLRSPDRINEKQKLLIPPLPAAGKGTGQATGILKNPLLVPSGPIGRRRLLRDGSATNVGGQYVVRDGDSLWTIAVAKLGDGSRYRDIAKLNAAVLEDEDSLTVGMRLKLPGR